ncbi:hypothetical protein [Streptomyces cacaoi]|uniref:hypothetical protein n=1 Tax=Streptomyces cacaoi TaxID=1898 RepID=UPI0037492D5F
MERRRLQQRGTPWCRRRGRCWRPRASAARAGAAAADLAHISPYLTEHIKRFGEYSTHELGIEPDAYDPKPDVDFTLLREGDLNVVGLDQAA